MKWKEVHFKLSEFEWTQLYLVFPNQGDRTKFFRECAREAIRLGPESRFVAQIRRRIERET